MSTAHLTAPISFPPQCFSLPSERDISANFENMLAEMINSNAYGPSVGISHPYLDEGLTEPYAPELFNTGAILEHPLQIYPFTSQPVADEAALLPSVEASYGYSPGPGLLASPIDAYPHYVPFVSDLVSTAPVTPEPLENAFSVPLVTRELASPAALAQPCSASRACSPASSASSVTRASHAARVVQIKLEEFLAEKPTFEGRRKCPWCDCVRRRHQDFDRHLESHCPEAKGDSWKRVCDGVPLCAAADYGLAPDAPRREVDGVWMVGGCQDTFCRRDSLLRHLKNPRKKYCVGHGVKMSDKTPSSSKTRKSSKSSTRPV